MKLIQKNNKIYTKDYNTKKLRMFNPFHSKIGAAYKKKVNLDFIKKDSNILYLGAAEGYTISYLSDYITLGKIFGLDISAYSMQKLLLLAKDRKNIYPILEDTNYPDKYKEYIDTKVDVIIQDVSQKNQTDIIIKNSKEFLKEKGYAILSLKIGSISQKDSKQIINNEINNLKTYFKIIDKKRLEPFEKKHMIFVLQKK